MITPRTMRAVVLICALTGCSRSTAPPSHAAVTLQVFADPAEAQSYQALITAYQAKNPGETVELRVVGKQKDHMARLSTAFAAGDPPDVFIVNFRRFGQFAAKNVLAPLGPNMQASQQYQPADFYPLPTEAFQYQGTQYCLPQNASSLVAYYNRTLFKAQNLPEPKDGWKLLEDALPAAQKLTFTPKGGSARDKVHGLGFEPSLIRLAPFIWSAGGGLVDDVNRPSLMMLDRARAVSALTLMKALNSRYHVTPNLAEVQAEDLESRFAAGKLGILLQSRRYTAALRELSRQGKTFDWDVAPLPFIGQATTVLHADGYCMARSSKNTLAAQAFIAYALSHEGQSLLAKSGRIVPSRIQTAQSPAFLDPSQKPARAQVFLEALPQMRRTPNTAAWHEVESKADTLLEEFFYEPSLPGETDQGHAEAKLVAENIRDATQALLLNDLKAQP